MKIFFYIYFLIFVNFGYSFSQIKNSKFDYFLSKIQTIENVSILNIQSGIVIEKEKVVEINLNEDSLFLPYSVPGIFVGKIISQNFVVVILGYAASVYIPYMITFNLEGRIIDFKRIGETCGAGENYFCDEYLIINPLKCEIFEEKIENNLFSLKKFYVNRKGKIIEKLLIKS